MLASGSNRAPIELAAYQRALQDAYFPFEITEIDASGPLHWSMETRNFGQLPISKGSSDVTYRGRRRKDPRSSDYFVLHLMERGAVAFAQPHNKITAQAGAVVLINPDPMLATEKLGSGEALAVSIPARLLTMYFPEALNWGMSMRGTLLGPAAVLRELLLSCWRQRDVISGSEAIQLNKALIHLVGATFGANDSDLANCKSRSMQMHFARIRDIVTQNLENEDLSADFVADRLRISKSYLFAILKDAGTTLGRFILQQRLERCRKLLCEPDMEHVSISEIAYSAGFRELPHFSRCFTKQYGQSPRAFRTSRRALSS